MRQDKQKEREFFDSYIKSKSKYDVFDERGYKRLIEEFLKLNPFPNKKILDIGSGTGAFSKRFGRLGLDVVALDISTEAVKQVPRGFLRIIGDMEYLPFKNDSFDVISFSGLLHHVPTITKAVNEGYRVLKPEGKCFGFDPNDENPLMWLYRNPKSPFFQEAEELKMNGL